MSDKLIKYSRNIVQRTSNTLALSNKLLLISEAETYYKLCLEQVKKEEYKLAKKNVLKALELHPKFYYAHLELIAICLDKDEYEDALHYSELALKQYPEKALFFYVRGIIKSTFFEKHEDAIADFSSAIEIEELLPVKSAWFHEYYLESAKSKEQVGDMEGSSSDSMIYQQMRDLYESSNPALPRE